MQSLTKNWLKIYLFYGAIFFSFGVLSWLAHGNTWEQLTLRWNRFLENAQVYSDLPVPVESEVPVFKSSALAAVLFYPVTLKKKQNIIENVQQLLNSYCDQAELKPIQPSQSLQNQILNNASGKMVFGLEVAERFNSTQQEVELYLDMPETNEEQLINRLREMQLTNLRIQRITRQQTVIYHIQWLTNQSSAINEISELLLERIRVRSKGVSQI